MSRTIPPLKSVWIAPGRNDIRSDAARAEFLSQVAGKNFDRALGGAVDGAAWHGNAREARGDIHDAAAIVDQRQQFLRQEVDAFEVNVDHRIEVCLAHLVEAYVLRVAGVVHEVIEAVASPALQRFADFSDERVKGSACRRCRGRMPRRCGPLFQLRG